ncbi:hypothetical protein [Bosea robiniae]|uniref:Uncharacterized protein n=1 Tax=Bosea robiniae TaxID=1036780 RepID=A0ABY0P451_9HYPH|nr:hypothetical protein [Bosea robiniae]SDH21753.1 hypothetical protein SAMN05421844_107187 [Bosea robiniae]
MTETHPATRAAERRRKAAARAREHRARAAQAAALDAAIVDALADGLGQARPGMLSEVLIADIAEAAFRRLREAGVERPKAVFKRRLGIGAPEGPRSCCTRSNR